MTTHLVIPDTQVKPGASIAHLTHIGKYIVAKRPDVVIQIGDFNDMESLSSYDKGRKSHEGRRYKRDCEASYRALEALLTPIAKARGYNPRLVLTLGNHEERILRAVETNAELEGTMEIADLKYEEFGFEVHDFLEVVSIDGIAYSHFFPRSSAGRVVQNRSGAPNAKAQLVREGRSCTAGHTQGLDIACLPLGGKLQWGLIAGSCYTHDETYLGPQGNKHWRGVILKNGVANGTYSPVLVDLGYLKKRFG